MKLRIIFLFLLTVLCGPTADAFTHGNASVTAIEQFVSTRARQLQNSNTTDKQIMCRSAHIATENLTSIKTIWANYQPNNPDTGLGASATITASVEYGGAVVSQIQFSGSPTGTIPNISTITADYTSTFFIPSGATYWIRNFYQNSAGIIYNTQYQSAILGDECHSAVSGLTDQTMTPGAITGGTTRTWTRPPLAIIAPSINRSALLIGDSRTACSGDGGESNNFDAKCGNLARSMGSVPFVSIAVAGATAKNWLAQGTGRNALLPYGSQVIVALGINDLPPTNSQTPAQVVSSIQGIFSAAAAPKKYLITIEPYTSGTYDTLGGQTNQSPNRVAFNTLVRAGISGATGFYEVANVVETSFNSTFWIFSGSANTCSALYPTGAYTCDGLHENSAGYAIIAASGAIVPASYP